MSHRASSMLVFCLAVALAAACRPNTAAGPDDRPGDQQDDAAREENLLSREQQRVHYLVSGDLPRLAAMLSPTLSYTHSTGVLDSKEEFLESLRTGRVVYRSLDHRDVQVRFVSPEVAILNGISDVAVTAGGEDRVSPLRFTIVYVKQDGDWLFEAWHSARRSE
jgi:uncharacterized protein (TIGR02246 family)